MAFSDRLLDGSTELWPAQMDHSFVSEFAAGALDEPEIRTWLEQDYRYLLDFAWTSASLGPKATDESTMAHCVAVANTTYGKTNWPHERATAGAGGV